jgi:hypothetical protein
MKNIQLYLLYTLIISSIGCSTNSVAPVTGGGDDFPNSRSAIALQISQNTDLLPKWTQFIESPDTQSLMLSPADSLMASVPIWNKSFEEHTNATQVGDSIKWDYKDTSSGIATLHIMRDELLSLKKETRTVLFDSLAKDNIIGNEHLRAIYGRIDYKLNGTSLSYKAFDSDHNGFLDTAFELLQQPALLGTKSTYIGLTSGNDNNFTNKQKLRVFCLGKFQILGVDTIQSSLIYDSDGDGSIFCKGGQNIVNGIFYNKNLLPIQVINQRLYSITNLQAQLPDNGENRWIERIYHQTSYYMDGHRERVSVAGNSPDSILRPNSTAYLLWEHTNSQNDEYDSTRVRFSLQLGASVMDPSQHSLLKYNVSYSNNHYDIRSAIYSFTPNAPLFATSQVDSIGGAIHMEVHFSDTTYGSLDAAFAHGFFDIMYFTPDGKTQRFRSNRSGEIVQ